MQQGTKWVEPSVRSILVWWDTIVLLRSLITGKNQSSILELVLGRRQSGHNYNFYFFFLSSCKDPFKNHLMMKYILLPISSRKRDSFILLQEYFQRFAKGRSRNNKKNSIFLYNDTFRASKKHSHRLSREDCVCSIYCWMQSSVWILSQSRDGHPESDIGESRYSYFREGFF